MANLPLSVRLARTWRAVNGSSICSSCARSRRLASTQAATTTPDSIFDMVESTSLVPTSVASPKSYDPVSKSKERKWQLPPSRYTSTFLNFFCTSSANLLCPQDTNTAHQNTIVVLFIHTNRLIPQILRLANLFLAHSLLLVSNRRTIQPLLPIS